MQLHYLSVRLEGLHDPPPSDVVQDTSGVLVTGDQKSPRRIHGAGGHGRVAGDDVHAAPCSQVPETGGFIL